MKKILENNKETIVQLESFDIESAIRQFICSCYPELANGYLINPTVPKTTINVICEKDKVTEVKSNQCCDNPQIQIHYENNSGLYGTGNLGVTHQIMKCINCGKPSLF